MSGLYTRTGTQPRVGGNRDVKEENKVAHGQESGAMEVKGMQD